MVLLDVNLTAIFAFAGLTITLVMTILGLWNKITRWWAGITGNEIDIKKLPSDSPLKKEFDDLHESLTFMGGKQADITGEIIKIKNNQKKIASINSGDILELKLMRGIDHKLAPSQIAEWHAEYKALGRNGAMDFIVTNYIHPQEFDYNNVMNNKGDE